MPASQASRRLVKSPPELWAEVSDAASLARHLGEVGEIRITRLEPETTVAWEGERASGTVELAPAGWGTSVTLTAEAMSEAEAAPAAVATEPEAAPEAAAPAPEPTAVAEPAVVEPEPAAVAEPAPEPAAEPPADPEPVPSRTSWLSRLFRRTPAAPPPPAEPVDVAPVAASPVEPEPEPAAEPVADVEPVADPLEAVLTGALDSLGAAHHRPFSRG